MIDKEMEEKIRAILKRGNEAQVRRKGDGYVILEIKKETEQKTSA